MFGCERQLKKGKLKYIGHIINRNHKIFELLLLILLEKVEEGPDQIMDVLCIGSDNGFNKIVEIITLLNDCFNPGSLRRETLLVASQTPSYTANSRI